MNYKFETVNCNLCKSDHFETISTKGKFGLPTNVVICKNCGLTYLNPRWDKDSYMHFYAHEYDQYYRPQILTHSATETKAVNPLEVRMNDAGVLPVQAHEILDIGSGEGTNLFHFKSLFPESNLYAIEPSLESKNILTKNGVDVISSDVDTHWDEQHKGRFDIVIMRHVLEHFMDPIHIMQKVRNVLKPSGILYVAVPNNLNPTQNLEKSWFRNVHTYYFNKYSLGNLCKLVGLDPLVIVEGDHFNRGEIYFIAQRAADQQEPSFSTNHYREQVHLLRQRLRSEKAPEPGTLDLLKRAVKKLLPSSRK